MSAVGAFSRAARSSPTASGLPPVAITRASPPAPLTRCATHAAARSRSAGSPPPVEIDGIRSQSRRSSSRRWSIRGTLDGRNRPSTQCGMDSPSSGHTSRLAMGIDGHQVPRPIGALFGCTVHRMGVTSVIELRGELDLAAREMLDAALEMALEPGLVMTVVVDLDRVTNADAFTVSWLLRADAQVRLTGARFVAVTGSGRAGKVLRLTGVGRRLDVVGAPHAH